MVASDKFTQAYCALTHAGNHRELNEDSYLNLPDYHFWAIADGMGGHAAGDVASATAIETLRIAVARGLSVEQAIQQAHSTVLNAAQIDQAKTGMGSTVVAISSTATDYQISWVGDSRAYLWRFGEQGGQLEQLTTDHSYVQMLVDQGALEPSETQHHPNKNVITQCLGSTELDQVEVGSVQGNWSDEPQWVLLCSDGLNDELSDQQIASILFRSKSIKEAASLLLDGALNAGGRDNVTVQLIDRPKPPNTPVLIKYLPRFSGHNRINQAAWVTTAILLTLLILSFVV